MSYVERLPDEQRGFWGCGECGSIWYDESNLYAEITSIVERFPYRRRCYAKKGKKWRAASPGREPKDYAKRVEGEPKYPIMVFERG